MKVFWILSAFCICVAFIGLDFSLRERHIVVIENHLKFKFLYLNHSTFENHRIKYFFNFELPEEQNRVLKSWIKRGIVIRNTNNNTKKKNLTKKKKKSVLTNTHRKRSSSDSRTYKRDVLRVEIHCCHCYYHCYNTN